MAFIGIKIPTKICNELKKIEIDGEKTDTSDMHITLICFEDNIPIKNVSKSLEAMYDACKEIKPFEITLNKVSCFPKRENNPCPIISPIKSEDLQKINKNLKKHLDKAEIDYLKTFKDYKPHITLSYADKEIKDFKIKPITFEINEICLWTGDNGINTDSLSVICPLPSINKSSFLLQSAHLFYKFATKY